MISLNLWAHQANIKVINEDVFFMLYEQQQVGHIVLVRHNWCGPLKTQKAKYKRQYIGRQVLKLLQLKRKRIELHGLFSYEVLLLDFFHLVTCS